MKGEITFGYETRDGQVRFFVSDTGIGIKQEDMGAIFDRFYKVENSEFTSLPRGSGIGLTISEMIVEKLGGRFAFDSVYGKGSTFSFIIPAKSYLESDLGNALKSTSSSRAGKVLVTEDEESNMLLITTLLTRMKVPFYTSSNGAEALELYKSGKKISLVLMDINMPLMNGFDAMIALKKLNPDLPVVALTAYAMQIEKQKALDAGFNDYLSKPVNQKHLEDCFKRFIGFESPVNQA
jgi:CheY-like chemotaxis protein